MNLRNKDNLKNILFIHRKRENKIYDFFLI